VSPPGKVTIVACNHSVVVGMSVRLGKMQKAKPEQKGAFAIAPLISWKLTIETVINRPIKYK